jgi:hypothetical protein
VRTIFPTDRGATDTKVVVVVRLALAIVLVVAGSASADPRGVAWDAPSGCPDVAGEAARIERRLGHELDPQMSGVAISIARSEGHYVATIDVADDVRTLTSTRCDDLADAVAVIVVRMVRAAPAPAVAPTPVVAVADPEPPHDVDRPEPIGPVPLPAPRRWGLGMRIAGVSGIGIVPQVGLGAEVAITGHRDWLMGEIAATRWLSTGAAVHIAPPAEVDVGLEVLAVRVGWHARQLPLRAWIGAETGSMNGAGTGLAASEASGRWLAAGSGFGVAWRMAPWIRFVGTTELLVAFERVRFSLGDGIVVYEPSPLSARTTFGVEVGWP